MFVCLVYCPYSPYLPESLDNYQNRHFMNIIAIAPSSFLQRPNLGDATQMRKTVAALRESQGMQVTCAYYSYGTSTQDIIDEGLKLEDGSTLQWSELGQFDAAHMFLIPHKSVSALSRYLKKLPVLVSTVYWNSPFRELVSVRNGARRKELKKSIRSIINRFLGRKSTLLHEWCSGILPNTWAEGDAVRKDFSLPQHAICVPVPNALGNVPNISELVRPAYLPDGDYIVCPGVFHRRKNQLGLIRAMKGMDIPVVFMGGVFAGLEKYYDECRRQAGPNMHFIGFKNSEEKEYWAVLKHARAAILPSDCETPGIAMLEAALAGARPIITINGGTQEYFGLSGVYLNPLSEDSIRKAVYDGWQRGRLSENESNSFRKFSWEWCAELTAKAYQQVREIWKNSDWANFN